MEFFVRLIYLAKHYFIPIHMRPFFFLLVIFFSFKTTAQVSATIGGSLSYMLASPNIFTITDSPLGGGGLFRVNWEGRGGYTHRFIEGGFDTFKFQTSRSSKIYNWNYLRATFGGRWYTIAEKGFYVESAVGFYGVQPSGFGKHHDKIHPGAGANLGIGLSGRYLCLGVNMHLSISTYGVGIVPVLHAGLNLGN